MNLQESIRKVLREEMNKEVKWLVRRLEDPDVMDDLDETVKSTTMFTKACGMTEYDFIDVTFGDARGFVVVIFFILTFVNLIYGLANWDAHKED